MRPLCHVAGPHTLRLSDDFVSHTRAPTGRRHPTTIEDAAVQGTMNRTAAKTPLNRAAALLDYVERLQKFNAGRHDNCVDKENASDVAGDWASAVCISNG